MIKHKSSLLIVEPSEIIVRGLQSILAETDDFNVLAPLSDCSSLAERLSALAPDVLLINPTMLITQYRSQLATLQMQRPSMAIVALVYQYVEPSLLQSFRTVLDIRDHANHVRTLLRDASVDNMPQEDMSSTGELSDREIDVLMLVAKGLSSKEIADQLCISVHTVSTHRKNITRKTGIKSVAGLAVYAMLHNLT